MAQINTREIILLGSQTLTTSGFGPDINAIQAWQAAIVSVSASTVTGTTPTFNFFVQKKLTQAATTDLVGNPPTGTTFYDDLLAFSTVTTNGIRIAQLATGEMTGTANATTFTTADWAQSDAALTQGSIRIGPLGGLWRVKWVAGGTTPSGVFSVQVQLIPWST